MIVNIPCEAAEMLDYLASRGVECHLVGGAVRDVLLGLPPRDFDFAFSGTPEALVQALPELRKVGAHQPVWLRGRMEFTPLHPLGLEADLLRRDFTLNALAVDRAGHLSAHPQALGDIQAHLLRAASPTALVDDPVRVWRGARLLAGHPELTLEPQTLNLMRAAPDSGHAAAERPARELLRALETERPGRFLEVLGQCGQLGPWLDELTQAHAVPAGPPAYHSGSVLAHTCEVMDRTAAICRQAQDSAAQPLAVWMALCHDFGKVLTPRNIWPHHYGHEKSGEGLAARAGQRLLLPGIHIRAGTLAARLHMKGGQYPGLRPATRRDLLAELHRAGLFAPFWHMVRADSGHDWQEMAQAELDAMLAVTLPEKWRDRGRESALHLRELQCRALREQKRKMNEL